MPRRDEITLYSLMFQGQRTLGLMNPALATLLGCSTRTIERWAANQSMPSPDQLEVLARHVHAIDPALAAKMASFLGQSLETLGIVERKPAPAPPPAPPPAPLPPAPPPAQLVENVVCAAAEAMDVSPRTIRPALYAAFARASELGVDAETVKRVLAPPRAKR